ncbi:MAG: hypothetical protein K8I27_05795 [Planctomycetes bacterium]|nr:hypothetical protein [Planctomycetota bacterium]
MIDEEKQKEKQAALEQRKQALEEELENYAQAGAYSPGLVKASRWVSRILYFLMAAILVFLLFNRKDYSEKEMEVAVDRAVAIKKTADEAKKRMEQAESERDIAQAKLLLLEREVNEERNGAPAADRAQESARNLVRRFWGERAYAQHWQQKLTTAEPEAHGVEPLLGARTLIIQAAGAPAAQQNELLGEVADFGRDAATQAVLELADSPQPAVTAMAWRVGGWLGGEGIKAKAAESRGAAPGLAWSLITAEAPSAGRFTPEDWVGYATRGYDAPLDELVASYKAAPGDKRLALLALLVETAGGREGALFKSVATSDRPEAEKILAVRWMGARKHEGSRELLKSLSAGGSAVAAEAKKALGQLGN